MTEPLKPPRRTTLYRFYDADNVLLYIGIAGNPGRRFEQHAAEKPWWHTIARSTIHHYDSREDAAVAELAAIASEKPLHNIIGNRREGTQRMSEKTDQSAQRQDRLSQVAEGPLMPSSLVGSFFHSDSKRGWQGCVVAEPAPGVYLCETFSWGMGESYDQVLVTITDMADWRFYDDHTWMNHAYDYGGLKQRWDRERKERETTRNASDVPTPGRIVELDELLSEADDDDF